MPASTTSHGQSGFMSVESIGNALFYLIMIGIAALVVSVVMNTGKGGGDLSAISMVRSNVQYVGSNVGNYNNVATIVLENTVPLLSPASPFAAGSAILPSGNKIVVATGGSASEFTITLTGYDADMCRKYAYYGIGSNFVKVTNGLGAGTPLDATNIEGQCALAATQLVLTSR